MGEALEVSRVKGQSAERTTLLTNLAQAAQAAGRLSLFGQTPSLSASCWQAQQDRTVPGPAK